jgi:hypothetical protein
MDAIDAILPTADRRTVLRGLFATGTATALAPLAVQLVNDVGREFAGLVDGVDAQETSREAVEALTGRAAAYRYDFYARPTVPLLADVLADLTTLDHLMRAGLPLTLQREAVRLGGLLSMIGAELMLNLGQPAIEWQWLRNAHHAAREAGDRTLEVWVVQTAQMAAFYGDRPQDTIAYAGRIHKMLGPRRDHPAHALAAAMAARAWAALGDTAHVDRAAGQAQESFAHIDGGGTDHALLGYSPHRLNYHLGNAYTVSGGHGRAMQHQEEARQLAPRTDHMERVLASFDTAHSLIACGTVDSGLEWLTQTWTALPTDRRIPFLRTYANTVRNAVPEQARSTAKYREAVEALTT